MKRKVYSFNSELHKVTGVQKVLMDVHHAVMDEYDAKIVGLAPFEKVHKIYNCVKDIHHKPHKVLDGGVVAGVSAKVVKIKNLI